MYTQDFRELGYYSSESIDKPPLPPGVSEKDANIWSRTYGTGYIDQGYDPLENPDYLAAFYERVTEPGCAMTREIPTAMLNQLREVAETTLQKQAGKIQMKPDTGPQDARSNQGN
jgi:hypothetical protein